MNSKDLILTDLDNSSSSSFFYHKETQTSIRKLLNTVPSTSRLVPRNISTSTKDDNVKKFESCEIIQDPNDSDSITIIKETFTEEVITKSDYSLFKTPSQNKFKYCKEVIQPYNKIYSDDCTSCPKDKCCKSKSDLQVELPSAEASPPTISFKKERNTLNTDTMPSDKSKSTFANPEVPVCDECKKKEKKYSSCCSINSIKNAKSPCEAEKSNEDPECIKVNECELKSCISNCINDSLHLGKKQSAACMKNFEKVIGVKQPTKCDEKPTYYVMKKPKKEPSQTDLCPKPSLESLLEAQTKAVATIKCALNDFVGIVYNKTKDCVNLIKTESCRYLPSCNESSSDKESKSKPKNCSNSKNNSQTILGRIIGETSRTEENNESTIKNLMEPAKEVMEHVASAISSTISIIKSSSFEEIADDIINSQFNKSSPHDENQIGKALPKRVSQDNEPAKSSMFALIKNKLLSMFTDTPQSYNDEENEEDDSAESSFEKYCEQ